MVFLSCVTQKNDPSQLEFASEEVRDQYLFDKASYYVDGEPNIGQSSDVLRDNRVTLSAESLGKDMAVGILRNHDHEFVLDGNNRPKIALYRSSEASQSVVSQAAVRHSSYALGMVEISGLKTIDQKCQIELRQAVYQLNSNQQLGVLSGQAEIVSSVPEVPFACTMDSIGVFDDTFIIRKGAAQGQMNLVLCQNDFAMVCRLKAPADQRKLAAPMVVLISTVTRKYSE